MQNDIFDDILSDIAGNNTRKANNRKAVRRGEREKTPEYDQKLLSAKKWAETMGHTASVPVSDVPDDLSLDTGRLRSRSRKPPMRPLYRMERPPKTPLKFINPSTY